MDTVCLGTSSGMAHSANIDAAYRQYVSTYTNCTYIDGNVELVFLTNRTNYDLSFLQVQPFLLRSLHPAASK